MGKSVARLVRAVDTNVLARFILRDDPVQSPIAERTLIDGAYVPLTVLLETAWLLRSRFGFSREETGNALRIILRLANVDISARDLVEWAIERAVAGADIADMFHIVAARHQSEFATFDEDMVRAAGAESPVAVTLLNR